MQDGGDVRAGEEGWEEPREEDEWEGAAGHWMSADGKKSISASLANSCVRGLGGRRVEAFEAREGWEDGRAGRVERKGGR